MILANRRQNYDTEATGGGSSVHQEKRCTPLKWELPHASLPVVSKHGVLSAAAAATRSLCPGCLLFPHQLQSQNGHQRRPGQIDQTQKGMEISVDLHSGKEKPITFLPTSIRVKENTSLKQKKRQTSGQH